MLPFSFRNHSFIEIEKFHRIMTTMLAFLPLGVVKMYDLGFLVFTLFEILCSNIFKILCFGNHRVSHCTDDVTLL